MREQYRDRDVKNVNILWRRMRTFIHISKIHRNIDRPSGKICSTHGNDYEVFCMLSGRSFLTFRSNIPPPSSGSETKRSKQVKSLVECYLLPWFAYSSAMKLEAVCFYDISINFYQCTWFHKPKVVLFIGHFVWMLVYFEYFKGLNEGNILLKLNWYWRKRTIQYIKL
jgi:hypothetical protein